MGLHRYRGRTIAGSSLVLPVLLVLLALALAALASPASAASGDLAWPAKIYDSPSHGNDGFDATAPAPKGGVYIAGSSNGPNSQLLVARYGSGGKKLWLHAFNAPGNLNGYLLGAISDRAGDLVAVGQVFVDKGIAVVKYSPGGQRMWLRVYDDPATTNESSNVVATDAAGNVYVAANGDVGSNFLITLIKYSPSGVRRWVRHYRGGGMGSSASGIGLDTSGNVYLTGEHEDVSGALDIITLKYDPAGHRRWTKLWNGADNGNDSATGIAVTGSGQAYMAGYTTTNATGDDAVVVKYSSGGAVRWSRFQTSSDVQNDVYLDIALLGNGDVVAAGDTAGHVLVARLSPSGATRWATAATDPDAIARDAESVGVGASGAIYVAGETYSATTSYDILTAKYSGSGHFQWAKAYDAAGNFDQQVESSLTVNGGVYVAGFQESASTESDAALVKYLP